MFLAATHEPQQIGNFIGLLAAVAVIAFAYHAHQRWMRLRDHSPTSERPALEGVKGVKPQVKDPSDTTSTPGGVVATVADDDLDTFVDANARRMSTTALVKHATTRYGASKSTVLRRLKRARGGRP